MTKFRNQLAVGLLTFFLSGCELQNLTSKPSSPLDKFSITKSDKSSQSVPENQEVSLEIITDSSNATIDFEVGFEASVKAAVLSDPIVLQAKQSYQSQKFSADVAKSQTEFQVYSTLYGGVEDVSDETAGLAIVLSASRMLFDGGLLDNTISAEQYAANAAMQNYLSKLEERTLSALQSWVELERYQELNSLIEARLIVLDPLIDKLEQVAAAGVGDVSQVAAAQRTVALIRVTQTDVQEKLKQAQIKFYSHYGTDPGQLNYRADLISKIANQTPEEASVLKSPVIMGGYAAYQAALASLRSVEAKDNYTVSLESKIQRPFGGSGYDSDESVGLVVRRTLYDGDKLKNEIDQAKSEVEVQLELLRSNYKRAKSLLEASLQTVVSMDKAIELARQNAANAKEEIAYLRQQLIIGQSTLDSVLSAEARLYDNESGELNFIANRRNAELIILASRGVLATAFDIE